MNGLGWAGDFTGEIGPDLLEACGQLIQPLADDVPVHNVPLIDPVGAQINDVDADDREQYAEQDSNKESHITPLNNLAIIVVRDDKRKLDRAGALDPLVVLGVDYAPEAKGWPRGGLGVSVAGLSADSLILVKVGTAHLDQISLREGWGNGCNVSA